MVAVLPILELLDCNLCPALLGEEDAIDSVDSFVGVDALGLFPEARCVGWREAAILWIFVGQIQLDKVCDAVVVRVVPAITRDQRVECPDLVGGVPAREHQFDTVEQAVAIGVGYVGVGGVASLVDLVLRQE